MISAKSAVTLLVTLTLASCSLLPSFGDPAPRNQASGSPAFPLTDVAVRPVCAPRGADLGRAFADAGCRPGDVVLTAPPGVRQATILAARVCDFGRAVVVQRREEAADVGAMLACAYAGSVRPVPE